jgi:hypothetical protein
LNAWKTLEDSEHEIELNYQGYLKMITDGDRTPPPWPSRKGCCSFSSHLFGIQMKYQALPYFWGLRKRIPRM